MFIPLSLFSFLLPLITMLLIMPIAIPYLRKLKFGQTIFELGPQTHQHKQGTPTMGGFVFAIVSCLIASIASLFTGTFLYLLPILFLSLGNMIIGFTDDYIKVVKKRNLGLIWWQKIIGQVVISVAFSIFCYLSPNIGSKVLIPFTSYYLDLGIFYIPLLSLFMIFMINSSNIQDGLDGLLSSVTTVCCICFAIIAFILMDNPFSSSVFWFSIALLGSLIGFLRFNFYPAKIFMGDTGSMFIGGAMVAIAMILKLPLLLILIFITPLLSSLSVILQRIYYKLTHGKRIFKMSPVHHHFELCGMTEKQIVFMYTLVTFIFSIISILSILLVKQGV